MSVNVVIMLGDDWLILYEAVMLLPHYNIIDNTAYEQQYLWTVANLIS